MALPDFKKIWENQWNSRSIIVSASILFLCLLGYKLMTSFNHSSPPPDTKVVEVQTVALNTIASTARFIGTIRAQHSTTLIAKEVGILDSLLPAGQRVKKGTLIAKIDNPSIEKAYELSVAFEKIAHDQYDRLVTLQHSGTSSKNAVEEKKNAWIAAQKSLAEAKIALEKTHFYAPFDSTIGVFKAREGTQLKESDPIVSLYDMTSLIVEFDITADILPKIQDSQPVLINGKEYPLTHVQRMLDEETHMCPAYVNYPCPDCLIGTTVDVDLVIEHHKNVIVIPFESIIIQESKHFVYLVKEGKAVLTPVTMGLREKDKVEITSGLSIDEQVIITGQSRLYPDINVTIHQPTTVSS